MSPFPRRLWWFTIALCGVALLVAGGLGFQERNRAFHTAAALVFGALVVFSAHREVALPQGAYLSPAFMVCMAAMVVFQHDHSLLAPLLVGMLNGLLLSGLTKATWGWIPFNAALSRARAALRRARVRRAPTRHARHGPARCSRRSLPRSPTSPSPRA